MKKFVLLFLALGLAAYVGAESVSGQRGQGAQGRGRSEAPVITPRQADSPGAQQGRGDQRSEGKGTTVAAAIAGNPKLAERVTPLLPVNTTIQAASAGFKSQGQFIAALNVSRNLSIPWDALKARVTGESPASLGNAIHALRPELKERQVRDEVSRAQRQAKDMQRY